MIPLEPLFCPCCTPVLLHTLAQSELSQMPQQLFLLGKGALTRAVQRPQLTR
jgi:hypothetical protein